MADNTVPPQTNTGVIAVTWWPMETAKALEQSNATVPEPAPVDNGKIKIKQGITEGYLNLGGGKIVNKTSQQYKALIAAWYDDNKIINMYNSKQKVQTPTQPEPVAETPVEDMKTEKIVEPVVTTKEKESTTVDPNPMPVDPNQDNSEARQQEIVNNLNQYKQANPGLFADKALFKKSFSYDNRSDLQKEILDNWYANNVEKVQKTTSLIRQPISSIVNQYMSGAISDTDISNMQSIDPVRYGDIQAAIEQNKKNEEYKKELYGDDDKKKEDSGLNAILNKANTLLESKSTSSMYEDYKNELNSPEMTTLKDDLSVKEGEIKEIDNEINATKSELEKKFKWSGISQGKINALLQDQTQLLQNKKNTLAIEYQTLADKYSNKLSTIKDTLEITEKEQQQKIQQEWLQFQKLGFLYNIYSDQQKRSDAFKMADIQYQRDIEKMQKQFDMNKEMTKYQDQIQNGDINSTDPYLFNRAIEKNVDGLMKQFDGLLLSSRDQMVQRVKDGMRAGKSYSTVLGEIMNDVRSKPEYKTWQNNKLGIDDKPFSLWNGLVAVQGPNGYNIMTEQQFKDSYNIPNEKVQAIQKSINDERALNGFSQYDDPSTVQKVKEERLGKDCGVQCAWYTNILAKKLWLNIQSGSTLQQKITSMSQPWVYSPVPVIWGFVTLDTGAKLADGTPAWHTWYVTEVDTKNGRVKVLNSNYSWTATNPNTKVTENWFPLNQIKASTIAAGKGSPSSTTNLPAAPLTDDQRIVYNNQLTSFRGNPVVKAFEEGMQQYADIKVSLDSDSWPGDVAGVFQFMKSLDPTSVVRKEEFDAAARSAGVAAYIGNTYERLMEGKKLNAEQRKVFGSLVKKYVENRAVSYNRLYDDFKRVTDNMWIDTSYLPTRASDSVISSNLSINTTTPESWQWSLLDSSSLFQWYGNLQWFSRQQ